MTVATESSRFANWCARTRAGRRAYAVCMQCTVQCSRPTSSRTRAQYEGRMTLLTFDADGYGVIMTRVVPHGACNCQAGNATARKDFSDPRQAHTGSPLAGHFQYTFCMCTVDVAGKCGAASAVFPCWSTAFCDTLSAGFDTVVQTRVYIGVDKQGFV